MTKQQFIEHKVTTHNQKTKDQAMALYFNIEKHFAEGGGALTLREINKMLGLSSSASAQAYVGLLKDWGLITQNPFVVRSILLLNKGYPTVVYGSSTDHTEPINFQRS